MDEHIRGYKAMTVFFRVEVAKFGGLAKVLDNACFDAGVIGLISDEKQVNFTRELRGIEEPPSNHENLKLKLSLASESRRD